jgi:hypothetical protein
MLLHWVVYSYGSQAHVKQDWFGYPNLVYVKPSSGTGNGTVTLYGTSSTVPSDWTDKTSRKKYLMWID